MKKKAGLIYCNYCYRSPVSRTRENYVVQGESLIIKRGRLKFLFAACGTRPTKVRGKKGDQKRVFETELVEGKGLSGSSKLSCQHC